jgi:hypothetical protein
MIAMSNDKDNSRLGFRIKWGDKEIEYFGESSKDVFITVFDYVKGAPNTISDFKKPEGTLSAESPTKDNNADFEGYKRISVDSGVSLEQAQKIIRFERRPDFKELVPVLPTHPPEEPDAARLVAYALQVGMQKTQIELALFKKILIGPNNYPFPGSSLGLILQHFREANFVQASTAQGRNRPFNLTKSGLDLARDFIRKA